MSPISEERKRPYRSTVRAESARLTRRLIVEAAARLFVERGYGATTVDAIAEAAGVSRKTVFTSVGGKPAALKTAIDWAIVGDDEPVPMLDRPVVSQAREDPDARSILRTYARTFRESSERLAGLYAVLESAAGLDPQIRALAEDMQAQRRRGMRSLASILDERGALRPDLDVSEAADILWTMNDPGLYARLVTQCGWKGARFERWLGEALIGLLVADAYQPEK